MKDNKLTNTSIVIGSDKGFVNESVKTSESKIVLPMTHPRNEIDL